MNAAILKEDIEIIVSALRPLSKGLDNSRIFLTGGTGFFGKWMLHSFLGLRKAHNLNATMTVLSRNPQGFLESYPEFLKHEGLDFINGDIRTFDISNLHPFDFVIHAATEASAKLEQEDPEEMYSVITDGTRHVLDFARQCSAKRFLFISSGAVYGSQPPSLSHIPETYDGTPSTAYGKGKKISEHLCLDASADRFECVIARPFAFVGPYLPLNTHFAIGNFIRDCLEYRPIIIQGDGTPLRSYMYAADLAVWLWTILVNGQNCSAYNIGSDQAISIAELAEAISRYFKNRNEIRILHPSDKTLPQARYIPNVSRAMSELNLKINFNLSQSLEKTIQWYSMKKNKG